MAAKLGRRTDARRMLFRSLLTSLFDRERIVTTEAKAREVRSLAERLITVARRGDLNARREVLRWLLDEGVAKKLCDQIAPRYADRQGGYTRVTKLERRRGDGAPLALLELV
jgi:large subunit ribosomal protein L17